MKRNDQLEKFIAIPSIATNHAALQQAIDFITHILAQHPGITVEHFRVQGKPSLLAYFGHRRLERFRVLFNAHVDVVPGKPAQFKPTIKGDLLYGRGALDMKAAALIMTETFCKLAPRLPYPLALQVVSDEEVGGLHGTAHQITQGVRPDFVICGEFTPEGTICNESKGICSVDVQYTGRTAHSAYPWDGVNAIVAAQQFIDRLLQEIPIPPNPIWRTTANIATMTTSNTIRNQVPDNATVGVDIRYIPEDARFTTEESALKYLQTLAPNTVISLVQYVPSHFASPTHPDVQLLASAVQTVTGKPTECIRKPGSADVRYYSAAGVPAVAFGVQGAGPHTDTEYVQLTSLQRYADSLQTFLQMLKV